MDAVTDFDRDARQALKLLGPDPQNWVAAQDGLDHNVVIVGGSQSGCAFAYALRRAGIGNVSVIDAAEDETDAGIWRTKARMNTLRTPKNLVGPELAIQGISFQSWYTARHGAEAYAAIDRIPRLTWAEYVAWFRQFLNIPVRYSTRLLRIEPAAGHFRLHLSVNGESRIETTRKIIVANGFAGTGGVSVPPVLKQNLPQQFYAHTGQVIDFAALRGKVVAIIGAAASAFDAAATALEAGAAEVHLFARRKIIAATPVNRTRGYPGAYDNYPQLPDSIRWRLASRYVAAGSTPPTDSVERAVRFANFHLHLSAPWTAARIEADRIVATAGGQEFRCDFAIAGTGYSVDLGATSEFADFADEVLLWRDRYTPPEGEKSDTLGAYPYLGEAHELLERSPGDAPYLRDIHLFNLAGFVSFGVPVGDVPSMKRGIPAVVARISRDLFLADIEEHERRLFAEVTPDFSEAIYAAALSRSTASK